MNLKFTTIILFILALNTLALADDFLEIIKAGDLEKVEALLKNNPDLIHSTNNIGTTPLHWATRFDHKEMVKLFLANKVNINISDIFWQDAPALCCVWR